MRIEHYPAQELKKEIAEIIGKYLDLRKYKIFFFGSRVSGGGNQHSDIDIGIEGPTEIPYEVMAKIKEDTENLPILYKIEIVDFQKVSSDFQKVSSANREYL